MPLDLSLWTRPSRAHGFSFVRLDGSLSQKRRTQVIQEFQSPAEDSPLIMLLSLKAGGVGLNLTAASRVFLMDPVRLRLQNPVCPVTPTHPGFCVSGLEPGGRGAVHRPVPPPGPDQEGRRHQGQNRLDRSAGPEVVMAAGPVFTAQPPRSCCLPTPGCWSLQSKLLNLRDPKDPG